MLELIVRFFMRCNHNLFISNCCSHGLPQESVVPPSSLPATPEEGNVSSSEDEAFICPDDGQA
jgi:hypothetical protein